MKTTQYYIDLMYKLNATKINSKQLVKKNRLFNKLNNKILNHFENLKKL